LFALSLAAYIGGAALIISLLGFWLARHTSPIRFRVFAAAPLLVALCGCAYVYFVDRRFIPFLPFAGIAGSLLLIRWASNAPPASNDEPAKTTSE
jgi:zinc transporter ZupT